MNIHHMHVYNLQILEEINRRAIASCKEQLLASWVQAKNWNDRVMQLLIQYILLQELKLVRTSNKLLLSLQIKATK